MKKWRWLLMIAVGAFLFAGQADAIDLKGKLKQAGDKAAAKAVEKSINSKLSSVSCSCTDGKVDNSCLTGAVAKVKGLHVLIEGTVVNDFDAHTDADTSCYNAVKTVMDGAFDWDSYIHTKDGTGTVTFYVKCS